MRQRQYFFGHNDTFSCHCGTTVLNMKLFVFDLDGTLLNTLDDLTDSVNAALAALKLPLRTSAEVRGMVGNGIAVTLLRALGKENEQHVEMAKEYQQRYYNAHCNDKTVPYDGIKWTLSRLRDMGYAIAVYTNKDSHAAQAVCDKQLGGLVDHVIGTDAHGQTKPSADRLLSLMRTLGVSPCDCLYCGDSDVDIATARNADIKCICATWGYQDRAHLISCGATLFADCPQQLVELAAHMASMSERK